MVAKFREPDLAIGYLVRGVQELAPCAHLEVSWYPKAAMPRRIVIGSVDILATLHRYCRRFVSATVAYDLHPEYGFAGGIQCRCDHSVRAACPCHCASHLERPIVHVICCNEDDPPTDEVRHILYSFCSEQIHDYLKASHELGFHPKHHH